MLALPPLTLYVHIPWCIRKCPYCDFNSHEMGTELPQHQYVDALCADLEQEKLRCAERPLSSIFIGGGTPSLFEAESYARLLGFVREQFTLADNAEITLEANPGTADAGRFSEYRKLGINRLSIGVQSFNDLHLQKLGRIHDSQQARQAIDMARAAGFDNFNLDLMYGLPGQDVREAIADLQEAFAFAPPHLSWYQLTIEPNTVFYRRPPALPIDELMEDMERQGHTLIADSGLLRYEVSAYARPGHVSLHNHNYWRFGDYIGIGAGAHGKLTLPAEDRILRTRKLKQPLQYLQATDNRDAELADVGREQRAIEFLMNSLRLRKGFTARQFETGTGLTFDAIAKRVEYLSGEGLLTISEHADGQYYAATDKGYGLLNSLLEEFM